MSGIPETIAYSLARYFERRICVKGDTLNCEPEGVPTDFVFDNRSPTHQHTSVTFQGREERHEVERKGYTMEQWRSDKENEQPVLRHHATGIRVGPEALDLVERVEFREPAEPSRVVFVYTNDAKAFAKAHKLARFRPYEALQVLMDSEVLRIADKDKLGNPTWYGHVSPLEPADVARRASSGVTMAKDEPWRGAGLCFALFVPAAFCRSRIASEDVMELKAPPPPKLVVDYGQQLVSAASQFDAEGVRRFLELRADPNWVDTGGCTALHRAVSYKRPCWPVLNQLFEVCDITKRTLKGELAVDLADACGQIEVADQLRALMAVHPKGKHMLTYRVPVPPEH
eukprot:TRINITY_DN21767_c0_g1_i1.p1 TRINITY_DN21767_c0_g1~~TRINITY_DN21767_c0_g1_i1.p1  ORF type:complete len:342 (-),score=58.52 TRINITY_DN21767_c0_g1_i1:237-1262(-)